MDPNRLQTRRSSTQEYLMKEKTEMQTVMDVIEGSLLQIEGQPVQSIENTNRSPTIEKHKHSIFKEKPLSLADHSVIQSKNIIQLMHDMESLDAEQINRLESYSVTSLDDMFQICETKSKVVLPQMGHSGSGQISKKDKKRLHKQKVCVTESEVRKLFPSSAPLHSMAITKFLNERTKTAEKRKAGKSDKFANTRIILSHPHSDLHSKSSKRSRNVTVKGTENHCLIQFNKDNQSIEHDFLSELEVVPKSLLWRKFIDLGILRQDDKNRATFSFKLGKENRLIRNWLLSEIELIIKSNKDLTKEQNEQIYLKSLVIKSNEITEIPKDYPTVTKCTCNYCTTCSNKRKTVIFPRVNLNEKEARASKKPFVVLQHYAISKVKPPKQRILH